jgi:hypothetical protein
VSNVKLVLNVTAFRYVNNVGFSGLSEGRGKGLKVTWRVGEEVDEIIAQIFDIG